jgi:BirA family biotin operon repressor/biotin-[acetyl-CoA-carboxylase] ligase
MTIGHFLHVIQKRRTPVFNSDVFQQQLKTRWLGRPFVYEPTLGSTNTYCREHFQRLSHGMLVITDEQTHGRGQHSRPWLAKPSENLTFSVLLMPGQHNRLHTITLTIALACVHGIQPHISEKVSIKWPNDIYVQNRKIGGILVESSFSGDRVEKVIIGVGLNINQTIFPEDLSQAGSLKSVSNASEIFSREQILADVLAKMEDYIESWTIKPDALRRDVNARMAGFGCYGSINLDGRILDGKVKFMGINEEGFPVFVNSDADIQVFRHEQVRFLPDSGPCDPTP